MDLPLEQDLVRLLARVDGDVVGNGVLVVEKERDCLLRRESQGVGVELMSWAEMCTAVACSWTPPPRLAFIVTPAVLRQGHRPLLRPLRPRSA